MPSGSRWVPPAIEVAWTDTAAVPVRRPTRSGDGGRVERCETWLTPLPPTRRRMRWPRPVFADAKAYLSSREAQQMSESELERELDRRGQELIRRLLQGHLDQRTPGEAAGPVEGVDDVERSQRRLQERHPETTFGTVQVARPGGWRSSMAPRRSSTSRAPPSTLRCGNRPHHVAEYVCKAVPVFHRHRRHRRGVRYLVRDRDGVHWCTLVLPSTAVSSMRGSGSAEWPTGLEPRRF